jgi:hypothetical protein
MRTVPEYLGADLLPAGDAVKLRSLLKTYIDERLQFYATDDVTQAAAITTRAQKIQDQRWAAVLVPAKTQTTPVAALAVTGMNDVPNAQGFVQAAWWNRIPSAAWLLMAAISIACCVLVGYVMRNIKVRQVLHLVLPLVVLMSLFLIADIDSPRGGIIRVGPQNLSALAQSLPAP